MTAPITVLMNFFVSIYGVSFLGDGVSAEEMRRAKIVTPGGRSLVEAPQWLRDSEA